ncbi:hypothetical protein EAKF1_ch0404 [Escherichia albertii KF1]|nr:hypothetical protein EAKF1_ch0404 [Escherichia albertii KF1]
MLFRGLLQNCLNRLDGLPLLTSVIIVHGLNAAYGDCHIFATWD